jgi:two-component sensor histidine kinase
MIWRVDDGAFAFEWVETGGPPVTPPTGRGFGSKLIERIVASYFEGDAHLEFDRSGIRFRLTAVPSGTAVEA